MTLIEMARANNVHILVIPPHTSHRVQRLDVTFLAPLSKTATSAINSICPINPHIFPDHMFPAAETTDRQPLTQSQAPGVTSRQNPIPGLSTSDNPIAGPSTSDNPIAGPS
ncbi:hypothetical protein LSAT2_020767, partial [Lamellibrachia satsuma]